MLQKIYKIMSWGVSLGLGCFGLLLASTALDIPGNFKALTVLSGSMEPTIKTGGMVFIREAGSYEVGDIVTFGKLNKDEVPTTHRIVETRDIWKNGKKEIAYITKGDSNQNQDGKLVTKSEIIGKSYFSLPYLGFFVKKVREPKWFFVFIILPASILIHSEIANILREIKKMRKPKKSEPLLTPAYLSPYVLNLRQKNI